MREEIRGRVRRLVCGGYGRRCVDGGYVRGCVKGCVNYRKNSGWRGLWHKVCGWGLCERVHPTEIIVVGGGAARKSR